METHIQFYDTDWKAVKVAFYKNSVRIVFFTYNGCVEDLKREEEEEREPDSITLYRGTDHEYLRNL